jgi:hypothetical protein
MNAAQPPPFRHVLVELFATANLGILGLDIVLAHSVNEFAHAVEWLPIGFSALATLLLAPGLIWRRYHVGATRRVGLGVAAMAIAMGITGMFLHLESTFFAQQSLRNLVYTAPFAAPLSYTGVGFLLLLNRMEPAGSAAWGQWVIFLTMAGFAGVLAVSLGDHAQNGFFFRTEWIPVAAAALAASFLLTVLIRPLDRGFHRICLVLMGLQVLVGGLGFLFHVRAGLDGVSESIWDNLIYGPPVFAPLLFANLAILGAIGLWEIVAREI